MSRLNVRVLPNLCALGPRLINMTKLFRLWMIYHFSDSSFVQETALKNKIWNRDPQKTGIAIEAHSAFDKSLTENRPGIIIKRHAWKHVRMGINNLAAMGSTTADGKQSYANLWQGSHSLFCIGGTPGEAEVLANEVFGDLNAFAPVVQVHLGLMRLEVAEIGEIATLEESGKNFVVPVDIAYALQESWRLQQDAPFLKRIDMSLLSS